MEKKYEIIKNGIDDYVLKYKDKEFKFKSSVELVKDMQEANKKARIKLIMDLAKQGMTIKELVKEQKKDGKTYYDNSNKDELEQAYVNDEYAKAFDNAVNKLFGMGIAELITDIGLETEEESMNLSQELGKAILGQLPR